MTQIIELNQVRERDHTKWWARWRALLYPNLRVVVTKGQVVGPAAEIGGWTPQTFRRLCDGRNRIHERGWALLEALEAVRELIGPNKPLPLDAHSAKQTKG